MTAIMTQAAVEKMLSKAKTAYEAKLASNTEKVKKLYGDEAAFRQKEAEMAAAIDAPKGRIEAFVDLVADGAMTQEDMDKAPDVLRLRDEQKALENALRDYRAEYATSAKKLEDEINNVDLPEQRRLMHKVEQYEEMLAAIKETANEHPTVTSPPA